MVPYPWDVPGRLRGVDVSRANYLTFNDWMKIKQVCTFASIKLTESLSVDDKSYEHALHANTVGLDLQGYAFLHSSVDGNAQAEAMDRVLAQYRTIPFKAREVMDWEDFHRVDPHQGGVGPRIALHNGLSFLRRIKQLRGREPAVYTGEGFINLFQSLFHDPAFTDDLAELATYDLWVASYRWDPLTGHDYKISKPKMPPLWDGAYAWQCRGDKGPDMVPGLHKPLDSDVFFGDHTAWDAWCTDVPSKEPGHTSEDLQTTKGVQEALLALGYNPGPIDGVVGPRTTAAVRWFQTNHGLTADGIIGPKTRAALVVALAALAQD